jgi:hypothetical protein
LESWALTTALTWQAIKDSAETLSISKWSITAMSPGLALLTKFLVFLSSSTRPVTVAFTGVKPAIFLPPLL